jgi:hypothetical protein
MRRRWRPRASSSSPCASVAAIGFSCQRRRDRLFHEYVDSRLERRAHDLEVGRAGNGHDHRIRFAEQLARIAGGPPPPAGDDPPRLVDGDVGNTRQRHTAFGLAESRDRLGVTRAHVAGAHDGDAQRRVEPLGVAHLKDAPPLATEG